MADSIDKIDDHVEKALARLLEQHKGKPRIEGMVTLFGDQTQDLEDVAFSLVAGRAISTAAGVQLDKMGTVVVKGREIGQSDDSYRISLYVKIGQNTSQGAPEKIISIYKLLTGGDVVFYQNLTRAALLLAVDRDIDPTNSVEVVRSIYNDVQSLVVGGVRVDYLVCFSPNNDSFALAGTNVNAPALGFGTTTDSSVGGKFAKIHKLRIPFSFAGIVDDRGGFGSLRDPLTGGTFVTT